MDSRLQLPIGTVLDGSYRIERLLGLGGFGITYAAEDFNLGTTVALKEYYPVEFGDRDSTMSVKPKSERHKQTFEWGRTSFLQEARMLARFRHPSIVRVSRVFEAHSTAYMVMDFEQGQNFEQWLTVLGRPPTQSELDRIVAPLLDALEFMHGQHFLHRDIAPDNIIVRPDGTPVLLDFGAARRAVAEMSRTLTGIIKAGYSPQEQYATDARLQGPWSDLYAFGATLYRAVTGYPPEEASLRAGDDRTVPATATKRGAYRPGFLAAIDACLKMRHTDRPQSVAQLRPMMLSFGEHARATPLPPTRVLHDAIGKVAAATKRNPIRWGLAIGASIALLGGAYLGFEYSRWQASERGRLSAEAKLQLDAAATKAAEEKARADVVARTQEELRIAAKKRSEEKGVAKAPLTSSAAFRFLDQSSWDQNCVADPLPEITVTNPPKHGTISFGEGDSKITQITGEDKKCMGSSIRSRLVYYAPFGGYVAMDQVTLGVVTSRGSRWSFDCTIYIPDRKGDCKLRR